MTAAAPRSRTKSTDWIQLGRGDTYIDRVRKPLQCLIYIIPFLLIYQIGAAIRPQILDVVYAGGSAGGHSGRIDVLAFSWLQRFFMLFGAAGNYLPALTVIVVLLAMHVAHKDKWELDPPLYFGMFVESLVWAVPVLVIGMAVFRSQPAANSAADAVGIMLNTPGKGGSEGIDFWTECVLSIGAGVYEELLFRLIGITLLSILFADIFNFKPGTSIALVIVVSAVAFSAYHLAVERFDAGVFLFRAAAGIYFAGLFIFRGFGIVVGAHAFYDLMVTAIHRSG